VAVLSCFSVSRNHAIGVIFAAMGVGHMIMPVIAEVLLENFSFRSTILGIGSLSIIGLFGGRKVKFLKF
jgi:fucose permease